MSKPSRVVQAYRKRQASLSGARRPSNWRTMSSSSASCSIACEIPSNPLSSNVLPLPSHGIALGEARTAERRQPTTLQCSMEPCAWSTKVKPCDRDLVTKQPQNLGRAAPPATCTDLCGRGACASGGRWAGANQSSGTHAVDDGQPSNAVVSTRAPHMLRLLARQLCSRRPPTALDCAERGRNRRPRRLLLHSKPAA